MTSSDEDDYISIGDEGKAAEAAFTESEPMRKQNPGPNAALSVLADECLSGRVAAVSGGGGGSDRAAGFSGQASVDHRDERSLVAAAQAGDPEAIRTLYDAYRNRIWTLLLYSIGDPQQVQDVFQSVFFKFFRGLSGFRFQSSLLTWIYRIARNECLNHRRRRALPSIPLENILGSRDEIDNRSGTAAETEQWERERILMLAVRRLSPKMRDVVILKYMEGLSYEEIGRAVGCSSGTVASRLNRALAELGERLGPFRRWL